MLAVVTHNSGIDDQDAGHVRELAETFEMVRVHKQVKAVLGASKSDRPALSRGSAGAPNPATLADATGRAHQHAARQG